jgi:hypothetical protein
MTDDAPEALPRSVPLLNLDRRRLLGYGGLTIVLGGAFAGLRPDPARAAVEFAETTTTVDTVDEALAQAALSAWGGYANGRIPMSALTAVSASVAGSGYLRDDAARQYLSMSLAFSKAVGRPLQITEGYRDYDRQVDYWNRYQAGTGNLAAYPGTSNHGWGISCDFGSGVDSYGTPAKNWMDANAPSYGWSPTGNGFSRKEPWHFDYVGAWAGPGQGSARSSEETDTIIIRATQALDEAAVGYTALVGVGSLRHLSNIDMVNSMRVVGTPYYEVDRAQFYNIISSMSVRRSAITQDSQYWRV